MTDEVQATITALRALADYLETNADSVPSGRIWGGITIYPNGATLTMPGTWKKEYDNHFLTLEQDFGARVTADVRIPRDEVCEKIPTGRTVTRKVATAWEEVEEDEYEWDCKPVLQAASE